MAKTGWGLIVCSLILAGSVATAPAQAQTAPPPTVQPAPNPDGSTSDYLSTSLRILFPAAPASLELAGVEQPVFPAGTPGYDLVSLGVIPDPGAIGASAPLTKTVTLDLGGGIRGRLFARPAWLSPVPDRFINPQGSGRLQIQLSIRQDAAQGAGLLPGQTNWGYLRMSLNGVLFDYAVPVVVGAPTRVGRQQGDQVFALYQQIVNQLDAQGDIEALIGGAVYPNGAQLALGLAVDYLGENEYNTRLSRADFAGRVAETLSQKDYNADGWLGFKPEDIVLGAPGWVLGEKVKVK